MYSQSDLLKQEISILMDRVFYAQSLTFFGEDGNGLYGHDIYPKTCAVRCFDVDIDTYSDDISEVEAYVRIFLDNYASSECGHAITDRNLRINLNQLLDKEHMDRAALDWAPVSLQGETFICLKVDAQKLLEW